MTGELGRLEEVELREIWPNEAKDFTPWLANEGLDLLVREIGIDDIYDPIQEAKVGDKLAVDILADAGPDGKVIIENQYGKTDHDHLGKIITYAADYDAKIVIWIFEEIKKEHKQAIDWLNHTTTENRSYFAVKINLFRISNSPSAPKFEIICKPKGWGEEPKEPDIDLSLIGQKQKKFWSELQNYARKKGIQDFSQSPQPQAWYPVTVGLTGVQIELCIVARTNTIRCQLNILDNQSKLYELFYGTKDEIEGKLGEEKVTWRERHKSSIVLQTKEGFDLDSKDQLEINSYFDWFIEKVKLFKNTFVPYIDKYRKHTYVEE